MEWRNADFQKMYKIIYISIEIYARWLVTNEQKGNI